MSMTIGRPVGEPRGPRSTSVPRGTTNAGDSYHRASS